MVRIKRLAQILALASAPGLLGAPAMAVEGDVNVLFGQKMLSDDLLDEAGVDGQSQIGVAVSLDFQWPVMLAIDLLTSSDDHKDNIVTSFPLQIDTDVDTLELDVGVRKFWGKKIQPYVGGGLALIQLDAKQIESGTLGAPGTEFSIVNVDDDDSAVGIWINAGVLYRINSRFHVGLDLRQSDAEADLSPDLSSSDLTVDSGGTHVGVVLGYHW